MKPLAGHPTYPYGEQFQGKLLALALREPGFAEQFGFVLNPNWFDVSEYRHLARILVDFVESHHRTPTLDTARSAVIAYCISSKHSDSVQESLLETLDSLVREDISEADWVRERAQEFAQAQAMRDAILRGARMLQEGDASGFPKVVTEIQKALEMGLPPAGSIVFSEVAPELPQLIREASDSASTIHIPTGIAELDRCMQGGPSPGHMCMVMGKTKGGKSHAMVSFATNALRQGFGVHHYSIQDLDQWEVALRYASNMTDIPSQFIDENNNQYRKKVEQWLGEHQPNLVISYFPADTLTIGALASHLSSNIAKTGVRPDLIVVDYADLLSTGQGPVLNSAEKSEIWGWMYLQLLKVAHRHRSVIWTGSQVAGGNWKDEVITSDAYTRSRQKMEHVHAIVSLNQTDQEKKEVRARVHVCALRRGEDGGTIPVVFNKATSRIYQAGGTISHREDRDEVVEFKQEEKRRGGAARDEVWQRLVDARKRMKDGR